MAQIGHRVALPIAKFGRKLHLRRVPSTGQALRRSGPCPRPGRRESLKRSRPWGRSYGRRRSCCGTAESSAAQRTERAQSARSPWPANGALVCLLLKQDQERFVLPFGQPESLSLVSPRESNQREGAPLTRSLSLVSPRESNQREGAPLTRRHCFAVSVPCATRQLRAGVNSAIHGLGHARLSPEAGCVARRCRRDPKSKSARR
jgi:hypothetical protein